MNRMNREEFFRVAAQLDDERLRKALWNIYWRGSADLRERIEGEITGAGIGRATRAPKPTVDATALGREVAEFVALARSGAYLGGDRRVSPKERTRWRFTFKRLVSATQEALSTDQPEPASMALESLIDLACETADSDLFRSHDPVEAAGFVVSDAVAVLWKSTLERQGFEAFAAQAAPQLIRWEARCGWTRSGFGRVADKETTLAAVLAQMLHGGEVWDRFGRHYVLALDDAGRPRFAGNPGDDLVAWHDLLLDNLDDSPGGVLGDIAKHDYLAGAEQDFFAARLAHRGGDTATARELVAGCVRKLPGHPEFRAFAAEIGADMPKR